MYSILSLEACGDVVLLLHYFGNDNQSEDYVEHFCFLMMRVGDFIRSPCVDSNT